LACDGPDPRRIIREDDVEKPEIRVRSALPADAPAGTWTVQVDYLGLRYTWSFTVDAE